MASPGLGRLRIAESAICAPRGWRATDSGHILQSALAEHALAAVAWRAHAAIHDTLRTTFRRLDDSGNLAAHDVGGTEALRSDVQGPMRGVVTRWAKDLQGRSLSLPRARPSRACEREVSVCPIPGRRSPRCCGFSCCSRLQGLRDVGGCCPWRRRALLREERDEVMLLVSARVSLLGSALAWLCGTRRGRRRHIGPRPLGILIASIVMALSGRASRLARR